MPQLSASRTVETAGRVTEDRWTTTDAVKNLGKAGEIQVVDLIELVAKAV